MATIDDRVPFVQVELGNRADLTSGNPSRIQNWIWQSYLNLASSYHFHEADLSVTNQWQAGMDSVDYPADAKSLNSVMFYRQIDGSPIKVNWKDIAFLRRYPQAGTSGQSNVGPPAIIASFAQQIFVRPKCDSQVYDVAIDYRAKPVQDPSGIGATVLLVSDEFLEVIDMGAMMRGHASLGEPDKANALQQLLYGYTMPSTGKFVPGLIATMWTRYQADAPARDYGIPPTSAKRSITNVA